MGEGNYIITELLLNSYRIWYNNNGQMEVGFGMVFKGMDIVWNFIIAELYKLKLCLATAMLMWNDIFIIMCCHITT